MASGVEFEEDSFRYNTTRPGARPGAGGVQPFTGFNSGQNESGMVRFLMRHGFAKSPASAQYILVGMIITNIIITYVVLKYFI